MHPDQGEHYPRRRSGSHSTTTQPRTTATSRFPPDATGLNLVPMRRRTGISADRRQPGLTTRDSADADNRPRRRRHARASVVILTIASAGSLANFVKVGRVVAAGIIVVMSRDRLDPEHNHGPADPAGSHRSDLATRREHGGVTSADSGAQIDSVRLSMSENYKDSPHRSSKMRGSPIDCPRPVGSYRQARPAAQYGVYGNGQFVRGGGDGHLLG